ncbi:MAG: VCBS repeat-containing protein, partial [Planctomycetes bacterium]|nr:VCBS repeat-containing protein [Planctomycetota bacterium]
GAATAANRFALAGSPGPLTLGDLDCDGFVDAVTVVGGGTLQWLRGNPASPGDFTTGGTIALSAAVGTASGLALADLDADGDLDLVVCGSGSAVQIFSGPIPFTSQGTRTAVAATSVVLADTDKDGDFDIVLSSSAGGAEGVYALPCTAKATFSFGVGVRSGTTAVVRVRVADTNRDGDLD